MRRTRRHRPLPLRGHLILLALAAVTACSESLAPEDFEGAWGAEGVNFTLAPTHGLFETSCWSGEVTFPLHIDGKTFEAAGTISWQGGAGSGETHLVTFAGRRDGGVLLLEVRPASLGLGPYTMVDGAQEQLPGCP